MSAGSTAIVMPATRTKILLALSGGVDSAVCAHLLKEQGYDVRAVVMKMSELHEKTVAAAKEAAESLRIPLTVLDLRDVFRENVISYFIRSYQSGITPNPCVVCNPTVKFKYLIEEADRQGCAFAATGHYAKLRCREDGRVELLRGDSDQRDQSYMLYRLTQKELSRLIFPLAHMEKDEVRRIAASLGLSCASAPDSQENCFIAGTDYAGYIEGVCGKMPEGDFIAPDGAVCGKHKGILHYTVGQRKHLGVALGRPVYVRKIDPVSNRIYLADTGEAMLCKTAALSGVTASLGEFPAVCFKGQVKIRSVAKPVEAEITLLESDRAAVRFERPQRAVSKGQSLVIYDGDVLLGGGFIAAAE